MRIAVFAGLFLLAMGAVAADAPDPCTGFKWDVTKERALFVDQGVALPAGKNAASAPVVGTDHLYRLQLVPQPEVVFGLPPGKASTIEDAYAGLARLKLDTPGNYRVSVDVPLWIDLVAGGKLAVARDFQGQQRCDGPHKIVEFDLTGAREYLLQFSSSAKTAVRVTVTQAPAFKN